MSPDARPPGEISPRLHSVNRPAMGADVEITTDASATATEAALTVVRTLEHRWSRFRPDSEISRLNASDGPAVARPSTARLIEIALAGCRLTRGWFDPTRGADLCALGYRRPFDDGWEEVVPLPTRLGEMSVDAETGLVDVPAGVEVDLGGIAKGWTADVAAALLRAADASHAGVAIGGDVRVSSDTRVLVDVAAPDDATADPAIVGLRDGGVAVSGPTRRRAADGRHHLIDPFTRRPATRARVATVISSSAAGAEMIATAAAIAPRHEAVEIVESLGATAWLVEAHGDVTAVGRPDPFLLDPGWLG